MHLCLWVTLSERDSAARNSGLHEEMRDPRRLRKSGQYWTILRRNVHSRTSMLMNLLAAVLEDNCFACMCRLVESTHCQMDGLHGANGGMNKMNMMSCQID